MKEINDDLINTEKPIHTKKLRPPINIEEFEKLINNTSTPKIKSNATANLFAKLDISNIVDDDHENQTDIDSDRVSENDKDSDFDLPSDHDTQEYEKNNEKLSNDYNSGGMKVYLLR
jgi:hypothetical protein